MEIFTVSSLESHRTSFLSESCRSYFSLFKSHFGGDATRNTEIFWFYHPGSESVYFLKHVRKTLWLKSFPADITSSCSSSSRMKRLWLAGGRSVDPSVSTVMFWVLRGPSNWFCTGPSEARSVCQCVCVALTNNMQPHFLYETLTGLFSLHVFFLQKDPTLTYKWFSV